MIEIRAGNAFAFILFRLSLAPLCLSFSLSQCIGHISSLLLKHGFGLAALKLMAESKDEQLLTQTLEQISSFTCVSSSFLSCYLVAPEMCGRIIIIRRRLQLDDGKQYSFVLGCGTGTTDARTRRLPFSSHRLHCSLPTIECHHVSV